MPPQEESFFERGIAALRAGERARARELLTAAVRADPASPQAWLWLAGALDNPAQQRECLCRVLALDPANMAARAGLAALSAAPASGQPPPDASRDLPLATRLPTPVLTLTLGAVAGVSAALAGLAGRGLGAEVGPGPLLGLALLSGPPLGLTALLLGGVLLRISGRWLGGRGGSRAVRAGLAWAALPQLLSLLIWLVQLALLYPASFAGAPATPGQGLAATTCRVAHGVLAGASLVLAVAGVAAAHRFSPARAAAAWLLAALLVLATLAFVFVGAALIIMLRGG